MTQISTLYGARFKSWTGGNGLARKCALIQTKLLTSAEYASSITWKNIIFHDVPFPVSLLYSTYFGFNSTLNSTKIYVTQKCAFHVLSWEMTAH